MDLSAASFTSSNGMVLATAPSPPGGGPAFITPLQVAIGSAVIIVNAVISVTMSLGVEWQLLIGAVRCVLQLTVLGYVLVPIFTYKLWWLVLLYACFMLLMGSWEASSRPSQTYTGMFLHVTSCIGGAAAAFICYTLLLVVRTQPWWEAQYFIPILGMLLGSAISGVSVGLTTLLEELTSGKDRVELLLSIGASRWEASRDAISHSVRVACMPIINQMNVVGFVSIPGMMTGQILSGSDPSQAARYQMIVMFIIAGTTSVASVAVLSLAAFYVVDGGSRLRSDRLRKRDRSRPWSGPLIAWVLQATESFREGCRTLFRIVGSKLKLEGTTRDDTQRPLLNP